MNIFPSFHSLPLPPPPPPHQRSSEMEFYCMEARALKSSFRREDMAALKSNSPQEEEEGISWLNPNSAAAEDLSVDCFLDFSGLKEEGGELEGLEEEGDKDSVSVSNSSSASLSDSFLSGELPFHEEDLAELEWVSQFVDDSSSSLSSEVAGLFAAVKKPFEAEPKPVFTTLPPPPFLNSRIPVRARTKRARPAGGRSWLMSSDSSSRSPSSSSPSSSASSAPPPPCIASSFQIPAFFPLGKKQRRMPAAAGEAGTPPQQQRRCSHCGIQKTPQWRTGPHGAKTLCNACGVRYKSGRLFPEYRPAGSPTFSEEMHSNSHRKVLEMRRKKEEGTPYAAGSGLTRNGPGL